MRPREQGTAMTEVLVVLPVLVIALIGIAWLRGRVLEAQREQARVHACLLYYASQGCTDEAERHPLCEGVSFSRGDGLDLPERELPGVLGTIEEIADWPVIKEIVAALLGKVEGANHSYDTQGPFAAEVEKATAGSRMLCNPRPPSWGSVLHDVACRATKGIKGLAKLFDCK